MIIKIYKTNKIIINEIMEIKASTSTTKKLIPPIHCVSFRCGVPIRWVSDQTISCVKQHYGIEHWRFLGKKTDQRIKTRRFLSAKTDQRIEKREALRILRE